MLGKALAAMLSTDEYTLYTNKARSSPITGYVRTNEVARGAYVVAAFSRDPPSQVSSSVRVHTRMWPRLD